MERAVRKAFILAVGFVVVLVVGCQEQKLPGEKKGRLVAAENIELRKQLKLRDSQIEDLKRQQGKQNTRQEEQLAECQKQKEALQERIKQGVKEQVESVLMAVMDENAKLQEEIKELKKQIE